MDPPALPASLPPPLHSAQFLNKITKVILTKAPEKNLTLKGLSQDTLQVISKNV